MLDIPVNYTDVASNLSHSVFSAIAAYAGGAYSYVAPSQDKLGIDSTVTFNLEGGAWNLLRTVTITVQLKSIHAEKRTISKGRISLSLDADQFNRYLGLTQSPDMHFFIMLLVLPTSEEYNSWLKLTPEELVLKKCMYWTQLEGTQCYSGSQTIYFPVTNILTPESFKNNIVFPIVKGR